MLEECFQEGAEYDGPLVVKVEVPLVQQKHLYIDPEFVGDPKE